MAINLNPGADTALVSSAARAEAANQLPDYSKAFESVSQGYYLSMMANNEMWKSITNAGVKVGVAIDKSLRLDAQKSQVIEDLFGTDAAKSIFGELQGYKDEMKRLTGIWKDDREFIDDPNNPGTQIKNPNEGKRVNPFSKDTKDQRRALRKKMNDYYGALEKIGGDVNTLVAGWANKLVDDTKTPFLATEWSNAIIQSRNGKSTANGNRVALEKDKNGDWAFVMYYDPKKVTNEAVEIKGTPGFYQGGASLDSDGRVLGPDGEPIRYTAAQISDMLVLKDENKNGVSAMQSGIEGVFDTLYKNPTGKDLLPHQKNEISNFFDKIKTTPLAWKSKNKWGEDGKSWFEEMNSISVESAKAYGQISNLMGNIDSLLSKEQKIDLLGGVADVEGTSTGITVEDFVGNTEQHSQNYRALTLALFNPGSNNYNADVTGELFKEAMMNKIETVRSAGWETVQQQTNTQTNFGKNNYNISGDKSTWTAGNVLTGWATDINNRKTIDLGADGKYYWDNGSYWKEVNGEKTKVISKKSMILDLSGEDKMTAAFQSLPFYKNIKDWSSPNGGQTGNYDSIINFDFIKMTEEKAEEYLKANLPEGFTFDQYGMGDAIKVMYGDKSIKINLQPNTTSGENKNIKKLQDFINEVLGRATSTGSGKFDNLDSSGG
tara:strand:+ start:162 stop:2144 length:1983 start_codon:yes stop_codon:yes gene_type:complete